ncbi:MAG: hypothetical protein RIS86_2332 [Planctomycetota bacterium]|jgi:hypothetical protein
MTTTRSQPAQSPRFETDCRQALAQLRAALIELYDSAGVDSNMPQEVARRFSINKTLTWTLAKLMHEPDSLVAAALVPGTGSLEKVIEAASTCGAEAGAAERVRAAARAFDKMAEEHVGDRASLELVLDSMGAATADQLEISRRLAYRGNSGVYGVQARARVMCAFLMPSDETEYLDLAMISGYSGFRRLRSAPKWPLFKVRSWGGPHDPVATERWRPVPGALDNGILTEHRRGYAAELLEEATADGSEFALQSGPVGNTGAFDLFRAEALPHGATRFADGSIEGDTGEFGVNITTPVEHVLIDLVVHESLEFALSAEAHVFARIFNQGEASPTAAGERLPIHQTPVQLAGNPPAFATPAVPGYSSVVTDVAQRIGCDLARCRALRLLMRFPPLGSTVSLRFALPTRP